MGENIAKPTWLRIAAAVILGGVVGGILFLIATLAIGVINNQMGMTIPIDLQIAENVLSLGLLILLIGLSIAYFWWKVETTPPSEPESPEIPESELSDE
jgi:Ca2+/Na+ antiporter